MYNSFLPMVLIGRLEIFRGLFLRLINVHFNSYLHKSGILFYADDVFAFEFPKGI